MRKLSGFMNYFSDIKIAPTTVTLDQVLAQVAGQPERSEKEGKIVRYFYPQVISLSLAICGRKTRTLWSMWSMSRGGD